MRAYLVAILGAFAAACGSSDQGEPKSSAAPTPEAEAVASPLRAAYDACTNLIRQSLPPKTTKEAISFSDAAFENFSEGDEFYFSFRSGMIQNASRAKPDLMTGSMEPSASCIGSIGSRQISSVTVNGADTVTSPQGF